MPNVSINDVVFRPEYSFLYTNEHLKNIMFLTFGGSHAYGTNTENSDIDIRGCAMNQRKELLGISNFEQFEDKATDTVIYGFNKLVHLLINCNPNCIELLGSRKDTYTYVSREGKTLLANRKLFLSQRCVYSFGGYANQQLQRLKNAVARNVGLNEQEEHILDACNRAIHSFNERYAAFDGGSLKLFLDESENNPDKLDIFMNVALPHYPLRDYQGLWNELHDITKNYSKINARNQKKDDAHLCKHMMHLIRLYLTCIDLLEQGDIITYREKDHDLLMDIRSGKFMDNSGVILPEFYDLLHEQEKRMEYAKNNTSLPKEPNLKSIEDMVMAINENAY